MIRLRISDGDLLESSADAIVLPIDGALPAAAGASLVERGLGRIARALVRHHPECELVEEIDAQVSFPLALGRAAAVELPETSPFRFALVVSLLAHHADHTGDETLRASAAAAFAHVLELCDTLAIESVATPLLKGGWRISAAVAMTLMLKTLASVAIRHSLTVEIRILEEPGAAATLRELARTFGLEVD